MKPFVSDDTELCHGEKDRNQDEFLMDPNSNSIAVNKKNEKKEFRLVRFHEEHDHLGIFVARQNQVDIGCFGYFVVHIIPDGLVKR